MAKQTDFEYIKDKIVKSIRPEKIILFGSYSNGRNSKDSDIDLLIVIADSHPMASARRDDRELTVSRLFYPRFFAMDSLVYTDREIQALTASNEGEWDLVLQILENGKIVYEEQGQ